MMHHCLPILLIAIPLASTSCPDHDSLIASIEQEMKAIEAILDENEDLLESLEAAESLQRVLDDLGVPPRFKRASSSLVADPIHATADWFKRSGQDMKDIGEGKGEVKAAPSQVMGFFGTGKHCHMLGFHSD